ncbi:MAG: hypothetical protein ACRD9Q_08055 [Nitrososphaeraceae archaeon]
MVALVIEDPKKVRIHHIKDGIPDILYSYPKQEFIQIDRNKIPAISISNNPHNIVNKNAIMFPQSLEHMRNAMHKQPSFTEEEDRISFIRGRKDESQQLQDEFSSFDQDDEEASILIQKLRELVIRFEKLLAKYLDPDIPTGRKARKKFMEERDMFRIDGYKDFINSIDLKVEALCSFENFDKTQFCKRTDENWFKKKIAEALKGNFYSAQEVVNSVMQIVKEEEYAVPKRRIVAKLK